MGKKNAVPPGGTASLAVLLARRSYINDASEMAVAAKPMSRTMELPPALPLS